MSDPRFYDFLMIGGAVLVALAVIGVGLAFYMLLNPRRTAADRVREFTGGQETEQEALFRGDAHTSVASKIAVLATSSDESRLSTERTRMIQAGFRASNALEIYNASRVVLVLGIPALAALLLPDMDGAWLALCLMILATVGYYLPQVYVENKLQARQYALLKPFPDALDLLVSSTEAGLGLDAALVRVAKEMQSAAPELSSELQIVNHEVTAGVPRTDALRHLDHRTGLAEINSLVNVLVQAERFGTSVAQALRIHSDMVRTKRMQAAEEKAAQISPKMTVAMILFLLPALFVVILGPAVVNVYKQLLPTLGMGS